MTDVLVVGAGPAGLTTALQAVAHGASVRVVERRPDAFRPSRALIVHPRTLECLRPLGVTGELLDRGDIAPRAELHLGHRRVSVELSGLDLPDTAFPHLTLVRQADVEEVLAQALARRGVTIERGVELTDAAFTGYGGGLVRATLRSAAGIEDTTCRFVAGCDGPDSTVRRLAGIGWRGASYRQEVVLADVELTGDLSPGVVHVAAGRNGLLFVFSLGEGATWRLLATRPVRGAPDAAFGQPGGDVPTPELQRLIADSGLAATIAEVRWSAKVRLQHRLAAAYRYGRLFLAGDAAHTHSPAGGQGMNTGIQDAVNLGWKLAYAADRERCSELLDSYGRERRPVARKVLAMTHLIFFAEASTHPLPAFLRGTLAPLAAPAAPLLMRQRRLLAEGVRTLSQLRVNYHGSPLSQVGTAPADRQLQPGDRLPDATVTCDGRTVRLHELTASPGIHLLLSRDTEQPDPLGPRVHVHRLTSRPGGDLVAVRPDGYVGLHSGPADPVVLRSWLDLVGASPPCGGTGHGASSY
ncbi:FAD-dependent monooxygenase [Kribbella sp. NPDC050820]|uniref:FAD-dependent monooxygenase n=1 Tax=Kribbella sp. NPDC050820 TaxID=3155408 RepID=UPI0033EDB920